METSHKRSNHKIGLCEKIFSVISCGPQHHHDSEASKASSGWVPSVFDDHGHQAMLRKPSFEVPGKRVVMQVEKEEGEKPNPIRTRVFSEYIERAGTVIRAGSSVGAGARKPAMRRESFNTRVAGYISRAKNKFTTKPSFVE